MPLTWEERFRSSVVVLNNFKRKELWEIFKEMQAEIDSLRAYKQNVEEALNSGDGSYRP